MPTLVPAELDDWMKDRQADLQEALEFGETDRVLESTSKLSEAAVRMMESSRNPFKTHGRSHRGERVQFVELLRFGAQVCSCATSDENSGCEISRGQRMGEAQKQKGGHSGSTKKEQQTVHFAALIDICRLKNAELEPQFQKF